MKKSNIVAYMESVKTPIDTEKFVGAIFEANPNLMELDAKTPAGGIYDISSKEKSNEPSKKKQRTKPDKKNKKDEVSDIKGNDENEIGNDENEKVDDSEPIEETESTPNLTITDKAGYKQVKFDGAFDSMTEEMHPQISDIFKPSVIELIIDSGPDNWKNVTRRMIMCNKSDYDSEKQKMKCYNSTNPDGMGRPNVFNRKYIDVYYNASHEGKLKDAGGSFIIFNPKYKNEVSEVMDISPKQNGVTFAIASTLPEDDKPFIMKGSSLHANFLFGGVEAAIGLGENSEPEDQEDPKVQDDQEETKVQDDDQFATKVHGKSYPDTDKSKNFNSESLEAEEAAKDEEIFKTNEKINRSDIKNNTSNLMQRILEHRKNSTHLDGDPKYDGYIKQSMDAISELIDYRESLENEGVALDSALNVKLKLNSLNVKLEKALKNELKYADGKTTATKEITNKEPKVHQDVDKTKTDQARDSKIMSVLQSYRNESNNTDPKYEQYTNNTFNAITDLLDFKSILSKAGNKDKQSPDAKEKLNNLTVAVREAMAAELAYVKSKKQQGDS